MLEAGLSLGLSVSGLRGPLKTWREQQLAKIFESGQTLRLQFPREDLGFVYNQPGAAVSAHGSGTHLTSFTGLMFNKCQNSVWSE